ncbi:hypothetical protein KP806_07345 [Paenibacillus sp. N4]|uniref:hypothetical protein n=1 Tax=Paenibacillus vietnamensis TaxID=2590547 RepID=UPI001CD0B712|nr:hypothetical protein [Paenibacillus vietnamensis]MCA0754860.1 hypothetical protein [Paenibacillus vietnamensis]
MRKASLAELVVIRYHDDAARLDDKIGAEAEIIRRQRKERSGKIDKHPGSKR